MSKSAWSAYWQSGARRGCLPGASDAVQGALASLWQDFAGTLPQGARLLDLACGTGAVLDAISSVRPDLDLLGVDSATLPPSPQHRLLAEVDCAALPFPDRHFVAIASQFGLEYCPLPARVEAARVLAPGGKIQLLMHSTESRAIAHNAARLAAMRALEKAGLFRLARQAVAGIRVPGDAVAVAAARAAHQNQGIATELPLALEQARAASRPLDQIAAIERRAQAEMERLAAMTTAAHSAQDIAGLVADFESAGVQMVARKLEVSGEGNLGWVVTGRKTGV